MNVIANTLLLFAGCTLLSPAQDGVYPEPHHKYVLVTPEKIESWCLSATPTGAIASYEAVRDWEENQRTKGRPPGADCSVGYKSGLRVMALENNGPRISLVGFKDPDGGLYSGWIHNQFIQRTPEELAEIKAAADAEARQAAAEAAQRKQIEAQRVKGRLESAKRLAAEKQRIKTLCSVLFAQTADKKVKDLTVREEQQVRACQAAGLYPPE